MLQTVTSYRSEKNSQRLLNKTNILYSNVQTNLPIAIHFEKGFVFRDRPCVNTIILHLK